ncbi:MAG: AI-2E family transporter [Proteobacteria bacterium]|nr:AI-2E family transporter [Pseudomonadota bacterium]
MNRIPTGWFFLILIAILGGAVVWMASSFFLSLMAGGMMALILSPLYLLLQTRMKDIWAALIATSALAILVLVPMILLSFVALRDASQLVTVLTSDTHTTELYATWQELIARVASYLPIAEVGDVEQLTKNLGQSVLSWSSKMVLKFAGDIPALLLQITLGTLSCFFFLLNGSSFINFLKRLFPLPTEVHQELVSSFKEVTRTTLFASLIAAICQSILVALTFAVLGIPSLALASGATFVFAWIPVLGSFPVFLAAGIWLGSIGLWGSVIVVIVMSVVTGLADNVVRPYVLKGGSDMHPLVSLVAILGGIEVFGLLGVVIGPVLLSTFLSCAKVWPAIARSAGWMKE